MQYLRIHLLFIFSSKRVGKGNILFSGQVEKTEKLRLANRLLSLGPRNWMA